MTTTASTTHPSQPRRIFADYAATAPLRPEAIEAMEQAHHLLNPAGHYASGRTARAVLEEAREQVAELLGCDPVEVIFTGSGTEADNIAIQGLAFASRRLRGATAVVSSGIEHPAVLESVQWLTHLGFEHREWAVDQHGRVDADTDLLDADDVAVATCMWANNETGNLQPVETITQRRAQHRRQGSSHAGAMPFHIDAVQAVGHVPVDFHALGVQTLAASAHKFGGPKSAGILLARRDAQIDSPLRGGGQERGLRSGTANPQAAAGVAAALAASYKTMEQDHARVARLRDHVAEVARGIDDVRVWTQDPALHGHLHVSFPGAEGDSLIMLLDAAGVDASTGSACSSGVNRASHVLTAMGVPVDVARGALRITLGTATTDEDARRIAGLLPEVVAQARAAGMAFGDKSTR
ncbi:cysteine desulfurase [Corynebacterium sp. 320]|uniref:cysteine desulfurase family protein n=1 Tax=Corynebacterium TaxID=1716 RepID=UPI00125CC02C|nr:MULTISPECIES: cysteine desulfurase family protein [Corynebacterium]KAB1503921.1 cysteine desulfurase [Corynebacterium sp. 320]KAB1552980.1 cysteine desulfurase [Corynebacterium sp. 321]KAB1553800.1 cysteine desulfurase [Corynebacterium sp. 319]KAB3528057.1 cysteine desulfurase [Corynebacterium sp. 250]KAB3540455.1 cysteine desulfurase [Corynebacterium sp. 366]